MLQRIARYEVLETLAGGGQGADHKKLVLNALQAEITVTDQKVIKLGVNPVNPVLITTERTSASLHVGMQEWEYEIKHILTGKPSPWSSNT